VALAKLYFSAKALLKTLSYLQLKLEAIQKKLFGFENEFFRFPVCVRDSSGKPTA